MLWLTMYCLIHAPTAPRLEQTYNARSGKYNTCTRIISAKISDTEAHRIASRLYQPIDNKLRMYCLSIALDIIMIDIGPHLQAHCCLSQGSESNVESNDVTAYYFAPGFNPS